MRQTSLIGLLALGSWSLLACQEKIPTTLGGDSLPVSPITVQVTLPFEAFAREMTVWGGYGRPVELPNGVVARAFGGTLDARTLVGWSNYPWSASVKDSTGTVRSDTLLTFIAGKVVAVFDTVTSIHDGPVDLALGALQQDWDVLSASWIRAVDSVGSQIPWQEEGGGPVLPLGTAQWDPATGDSAVFTLDSAAVALWTDTTAAKVGVRLDALSEGVRLNVMALRLLLTTRARSNPDTLVELTVAARTRTFIYQPILIGSPESFWAGGVPAWRTVMEMDFPDTVDLPPGVCAQVKCPVTLTPESLVSATLVLRTQAPPPGFEPSDTIRMDVREVLEPTRMPKSPLGFTLAGFTGIRIPPEHFGAGAGAEVLVPLGAYFEGLIRAKSDPEVTISSSLAFLSAFEPLSLQLASFGGPGSPGAPELRLLLTLGEGVQIR